MSRPSGSSAQKAQRARVEGAGAVCSANAVRQALDAAMSEREVDRVVRDLLALRGYRLVYHTFFSARSSPGFPDLVAVRTAGRPRVVFLELKGSRGKLSVAQLAWLQALADAGADVRTVYPCDLDDASEYPLAAWLA